MNYKTHSTSLITVLLSLFFLAGCETGYRDYRYVIRHAGKETDNIQLTYTLINQKKFVKTLVQYGDTFHLYERTGVSGDEIWNVETSSTMYPFPNMVASKEDSSWITEELPQRVFWSPQPRSENGVGVYELNIEDTLFVLRKMQNSYFIKNKTNESIIIKCTLLGNTTRRDTIEKDSLLNLGTVDKMYVYDDDNLKNTDKYKERKLSVISSLSIIYQGITKNENDLKKPYSYNKYWSFEREQNTLNVCDSIFIPAK